MTATRPTYVSADKLHSQARALQRLPVGRAAVVDTSAEISTAWLIQVARGDKHELIDHYRTGFHFRISLPTSTLSSGRSEGSGGRTGPAASPISFIISFITVTSYPLRPARSAYNGITYSRIRHPSSLKSDADAVSCSISESFGATVAMLDV